MRSLVLIALALVACKGKTQPPDAAATPPPIEEGLHGVGWRVRGDMLEDAGTAVRLKVPAGWRVLPANTGLRIAGQVAFSLIPDVLAADADDDDVYFAVDGNPIGAGDPAPHQEALVAKSTDEWHDLGDPRPFKIDGVELLVHRQAWGDPVTYERLFGSVIFDHRYLEVKLQYPIGQADAMRPQFGAFIAGMGLLDRRAVAALIAELRVASEPQDLIGADFAYHEGVFRDFAGGYAWRAPAGLWRIKVITTPADSDPSQRLVATDVTTGTTVYIGSEAWSGTEAGYVDTMRARIGTTTIVSDSLTKFANRAGIAADLDVESTVPYRMRLAQARAGGRMISLLTDNLAAAWPGPEFALAAEAGLTIEPQRADDDGPPFKHWRAGVGVMLGPPWEIEPGWFDDGGAITRAWHNGAVRAQLIVKPDPLQPPPAHPPVVVPGMPVPPTPQAATLDGHPATLVRRGDVFEDYTLDRGGTSIEWIITGSAGPEFDEARRALRLLDARVAAAPPL